LIITSKKALRKRYKDWEDSLEGVMYNLAVFGAETAEDAQHILLIAKTILRLPEDVREKVLDEVNFIVAGELTGTEFRLDFGSYILTKLLSTGKLKSDEENPSIKLSNIVEGLEIPFILLNFANMREKSETEKMSIIAHEIAHFILGHKEICSPEENTQQEKEADDLIEKWGFKRAYKDYES
jgi:hypothetical protein